MVERHPIGRPRAPIVPGHKEPGKTKLIHCRNEIHRHLGFCESGGVGQFFRGAARAIAAKITGNDGVVLTKTRGELMPAGMRLGIAMD
jgi:hypothetical protein